MKRNRKLSKNEYDVSESEEEDLECNNPNDELDSDESEPEFIEEDIDSDISDYNLEEDDENEEESDLSEEEFDEDTKLPILTSKLSDRLLKNSSNHTTSSIKKLLNVFSEVVGSMASNQIKLTSDNKLKNKNKDNKVNNLKLKFKYLKNENKRLLKGTAERYTDNNKLNKRTYIIKYRDVYSTFVSKTFDVMSDYIKTKDILSKKEDVISVAPIIRRFLSTSIVQLAFSFDDFDLTRSSLISLSSKHVVKWICVFKHVNNQFVKIVSSLMCGHPQKLTRINCYQFLLEYLKCLKDNKLMNVQLSPRSYTVNYQKLTESEKKQIINNNIDYLLKRCYSSHVKSVMNGITLKNYGLFKLSQNCISELYLQTPYDNLYVHGFKCIRDLAANVRREWNQANIPNNKKKENKKKNKKQKNNNENKDNKVNTKKEIKDEKKDTMHLTVCSWGFIESVNIWVSVLSRSNEKMRVLVYPLVTVVNSAIKIKISNTRQMPFVLHLLTCLNQLSDGVNKFIPMASFVFYLLENLKNFKQVKSDKAVLEKSDDIMTKLRISNKSLYSLQARKVLYKHVELVLVDHLGLVSLSPSFPEFTVPVLHYLKKYLKSSQVLYEFKNSMNTLFKVIKETNAVVTDMREHLSLEKSNLSNMKLLDGSKVPMFRHRQQLLSKYQELNKEKLMSTLQVNQLNN